MQTTFLTITQMFQMQALMGMGKLMNPMTGAVERNLDHAKFCIDVLGVMEEKTKNNLTDEEQRTLKFILQDLRLNFVAETAKDGGSSDGAALQPDGESAGTQADALKDGE